MNAFIDLVKNRYSVRKYNPHRQVEPEKLHQCLEAARLAPSASNSQPWTFIVVNDPLLKDQVARETYDMVLTFNKFVPQAPVLVVIVLEKPRLITQIGGRIKKKEYPLIDIGIAAEHFCLQATELGLGTCMLGWFNEKKIKQLLNIPENKSIGLIISVGYPENQHIPDKKRKPFHEIVRYNTYDGPPTQPAES